MRLTKDGLMFSDLAMSSIDAWVQIISDNSMVLDLIRTAVEMVNRSVLCLHSGFLSFHSNGLARTPTMMPSR